MQASSPTRDAAGYALVPALVLPEGKVPAGTAVFAYAMATGQVEEASFVSYAIKDAAHDWLWIVRKDELDVARAGEAE